MPTGVGLGVGVRIAVGVAVSVGGAIVGDGVAVGEAVGTEVEIVAVAVAVAEGAIDGLAVVVGVTVGLAVGVGVGPLTTSTASTHALPVYAGPWNCTITAATSARGALGRRTSCHQPGVNGVQEPGLQLHVLSCSTSCACSPLGALDGTYTQARSTLPQADQLSGGFG